MEARDSQREGTQRTHRALALVCVTILIASCGDGGDRQMETSDVSRSDVGDVLPDIHDVGSDPGQNTDAGHDLLPDAADTADTADVPVEPRPCDLATLRPENRQRVALLGHPFGSEVATDGTEIRSLTVGEDGTVTDDGVRLDVGFVPRRIEFTPSGTLAVVLGGNGELATVAVQAVAQLTVLDTIQLPSADYGDLHVHDDGVTVSVVGSNVAETSGVSVVTIQCDPETLGRLTEHPNGFLNLRLTDSLAFLDLERAILLGGQAVFEPEDPNDIRLIGYADHAWTERAAFDLFDDFVGASRIAASPDGTQVLIPNEVIFSADGGSVAVLQIEAETVTEHQRILDLPDVRTARYAPDGSLALVTQTEPGRVRALIRDGASVSLSEDAFRVGVADQLAGVDRGALRGLVLAPGTDPNNGPELVVLRALDGQVTELQRLPLQRGFENIPGAVALQP